MRHRLIGYLDNAITGLLLLVAGITPILFLNQTTEFYEMPKLVFLVVSTILLLGLWIFSWILKGEIVIRRTPLDFPLLFLLIVIIASTYFSDSRFTAIYGNFPRVHGSAVAWATYILLYFVTVSNLNSLSKLRMFLYMIYGSAVLVSILTVLSYFGLFLPVGFAQVPNFTPTGSSFSTIALLLLLLPLPLYSLLNPNRYIPTPLAIALSTLFSITIVLIGSPFSYAVLAIAAALCFFTSKPQQIRRFLGLFLVPLIATGVMLLLSYVPLPGGLDVLQQRQVNFPREIQLPFTSSWKISASAFRDKPFVGTGPSTYLYNFTSYKPVEFNQEQFWSFTFDSAFNELFHTLGTLGFLGFFALLAFIVVIARNSIKNLTTGGSDDQHHSQANILQHVFAISALVSIALLFIHATTLVSTVITLFILAALMVSQSAIRDRVMTLSLGLKASTADNRQFDLLPVIIFIVFLAGAIPVLYNTYTAAAADYYHRLALSQANTNGTLTYQYLQRAESLNPRIDLYRVDMAQLNFALANALAAQKGPTEENPQGTLTDQDRRTIQTLLSQAINEGRAGVALAPRSARNWSVLAAIYRNISGVSQNALAFSLDSYGRAIQRDPLNPLLRINVGGIYYAIQNYDLAIRFFSDAANLKPDYANAYYNLAIALRDKGDLQNAQVVAEQAVVLLRENQDSQDFRTATELLADLRERAPAAQTDSALQNPDLENVDVEDLDTPPDEVATPAAAPRNPNARLPQLTPTQAPEDDN